MEKPHIPSSLPPVGLARLYSSAFVRLLGEANRALARLGELPHLLPNPDLLASPLLKREAVLSSRIEGTQTTLAQLFKYEARLSDANAGGQDAREVSNYVKALHQGTRDVERFALSHRTITGMHRVLLAGARRDQGVPGRYRTFQNYIAPTGTPIERATYVPPPPQDVPSLMGTLEAYMNRRAVLEDPLVQCGLVHYQFEAIHPFGDGNGRIGRLLIPLFFYERKIIGYPLAYVSEFFEQRRKEYYERLRAVSEQKSWKPWLLFFLQAIKTQSEDTHRRGESVFRLYKESHETVRRTSQSPHAVALVDHLFRHPLTAAPFLSKELRVTSVTAMRLLEQFARQGLLERSRGVMRRPKNPRPVRVYVFRKLMRIVSAA